MDNFQRSFSRTLKFEGGYVNHPKDPGGATNLGVTQAVYSAWRVAHSQQDQSVMLITTAEAANIYLANYWYVCKCDQLPAGWDYAVFDYAVASGPTRAIQSLQAALGQTPDGVVGPKTIAAVIHANEMDLARYLDDRRDWLKSRALAATFPGWFTRVEQVKLFALADAA